MRGFVTNLVLMVAAAAGLGLAEAPTAIRDPEWVMKPDGGDLEAYYPDKARKEGVNGRATIECTVEESGNLIDCTVIDEAPVGYGFGEATVRASAKFRMKPRTVNGAPVRGATVRVPIIWSLGSGVLPPRANTLDPRIVAAPPVVIYRNSRFYPRGASEGKVEGRAVVECTVKTDHGVENCTTLAAAPAAQGFEQSALAHVLKLRAPSSDTSGDSAGRRVRFPVFFRPTDSRGSSRVDIRRDGDIGVQPPPPPGRQ